MSKYGAIRQEGFRSKLEKFCSEALTEAKLEFEYEPYSIQLLDDFYYPGSVYEPVKKKGMKTEFTDSNKKVFKIRYTPDFVGENWIIETKGMRTPDFNIK